MARKRRRAGGKGGLDAAVPSLTSLMDIVTIILIYFVKTFAASPITVQDPSVKLPMSTSLESPQDAIVVMITGAQRMDRTPDGRNIWIESIPVISVDDQVIIQLDQKFEVPKASLERQFVIRPLKQKLLEVKKMQNITSQLTDKENSGGKIIFVLDKHVPFRTVSKALVTAGEAGFPEFKFAIVKLED